MPSSKPPIQISGHTSDGDYVKTIHLTGPDGMTASILTLGARLVDLRMPDGRPLVLALTSLNDVQSDDAYIGVVVGRTANRVRNGLLTADDRIATNSFLEKNENNVNHIHGGRRGWDKKIFSVRSQQPNEVHLVLHSPDYDQGYPSAVEVSVHYNLKGAGQFSVVLSTKNTGSAPTVTNMTMHPYFDLTCQGGRVKDSVFDYHVEAPHGSKYLVLDDTNVPTGQVASVAGTRFDFRQGRKIHEGSGPFSGYDQFFVIRHDANRDRCLQSIAKISVGAVEMEVISDQDGFQMYTSNGFDGSGPGNFQQYGSIAIEPSGLIDAGNNVNFPTITLESNETRRQTIIYKFRTVD